MRQTFTMTQEDLNKLLEAAKPVPLIMLQIGMPRSAQERANDAWKELGDRMGFEWDTAQPVPFGNGPPSFDPLTFTAEPKQSS